MFYGLVSGGKLINLNNDFKQSQLNNFLYLLAVLIYELDGVNILSKFQLPSSDGL